MPRFTVDVEKLFVGLYSAALTGVTVMAAPDVDAVDSLPLLIISPVTGAMIRNGIPSAGWRWSISWNLLAEGHGAASDFADLVYETTHSFDNSAVLVGVGAIGSIEDDEMPRRVGKAEVPAGNITQFSGSFTAVIRPV